MESAFPVPGKFPSKSIGIFRAACFHGQIVHIVKGCFSAIAAEQKARTTYENLLHLADDPDVKDVLRYLRQREIVHYQRFAEGLELMKDRLNERNFYAFNPSLPKDLQH